MSDLKGQKFKRVSININEGNYVKHNGDIYKISHVIEQQEIVGIDVKTKQAVILPINELEPVDEAFDNGFLYKDLDEISDANWKILKKRMKIIAPLLNDSSGEKVKDRATECKLHYTTVYEYLRRYRSTLNVTSLIPKKAGVNKGFNRLKDKKNEIIEDAINNHYLVPQRPSIQYVHELIVGECDRAGIKPPCYRTVWRRIQLIPDVLKMKRHGMRSKAQTKYDPAPGQYKANYPLEIVQIDHTKMDIILVDDDSRQPIGRPWITLAIDIYSRMITGYYLSLDAPSGASIAMCLAHSINPKDDWLTKFGIKTRWPVWGKMTKIHSDNGADFKAGTLEDACKINQINYEFRPLNKTNYGGHIERILGTLLKQVHSLPGTTFSNIEERLEYNSEEKSTMTFSDFEQWLAILIADVYHNKIHTSLNTYPLKMWDLGMTGQGAVGYPDRPLDSQRVLLDFLPSFKRTVQKTGVKIEGISYFSQVLIPFIKEEDNQTKRGLKHTFKRDPRDITYIWFYEENLQEYFKIPCSDPSGATSLHELREIKKYYKTLNEDFDSSKLSKAKERMSLLVSNSKTETKKARANKQKKKENDKSLNTSYPTSNIPLKNVPKHEDDYDDDWDDDAWDDDEWN